MTQKIHRCIFKICPSKEHRTYYEYQKGIAVVLMSTMDGFEVERVAISEIERRKWLVEELDKHDVLVEDRVIEEGGAILNSFRQAQQGEIIVEVFFDKVPMRLKSSESDKFKPSRLNEDHFDDIVTKAGGRRITEEDVGGFNNKNADYVIGDIVLELKDLQKEGLEVPTRQEKIYDIFRTYIRSKTVVNLNSIELHEKDFHKYCDIVGRPIQKCIQKAAKQIQETIRNLPNKKYIGGIILLNTGYCSIPHELFELLAKRYARKDTSAISHVIVVSTSLSSDGFNIQSNYAFTPDDSDNKYVDALNKAFWSKVFQIMKPANIGTDASAELQTPRKLLKFERDGYIFTIPAPNI